MARVSLTEKLGWRVRIPAHTIHGQALPETVSLRHERDRSTAILLAVLDLHAAHDVAPWRPFTRLSVRLAKAERAMVNALDGGLRTVPPRTGSSSDEQGDREMKAIAARAKREAKAAGALDVERRRALTHAQREMRDAAILAALHAGQEVRQVAREFGISTKRVLDIEKAFGLRRTALEAKPMEIIERLLRGYESQMARFQAVAAATLQTMPAVAVGAMKGEADVRERYANLLADVGKLPDNLELYRSEMEMRAIAQRMVDKLDEVAAGQVSAQEARDYFDALTEPTSRLVWDAEAIEMGQGDAG